MENKKILKLLEKFQTVDYTMSAQECALTMDISVSSIKKMISELKRELKENGADILGKSGHGNGYLLKVYDNERYNHYINVILKQRIQDDIYNYNNQSSRITYMIDALLTSQDYIRSDDFIDELCISKSQVSKDLTQVKNFFNEFGIQIFHKPHYGMKALADEKTVRLALATLYMDNPVMQIVGHPQAISNSREQELNNIKDIIITSANLFHYELTDVLIHNLLIHLFVAKERTKEGHSIEMDHSLIEELSNRSEAPLAKFILKKIEESFDVQFDEKEIYYVTMHLSAKKLIDESYIVDEQIISLVDGILNRIYEEYSIDLSENKSLKTNLILHTTTVVRRISYGMILKNPLLEDIKNNFIFEYELALCGCSYLNHQYNVVLSPDEISYYAIHYRVALNSLHTKSKKRILIVCSSGRGTSQMLLFDFKRKYSNMCELIETCNSFEIMNIDFSKFDIVFTTVSLPYHIPIPVFKIKYFIDELSENIIDRILKDDDEVRYIKNLFKPELMQFKLMTSNKDETIKNIVDHIKQNIDVTDDFLECVLKRESLENTRLGPLFALPHPDKPMPCETIISLNVLDKPIDWGDGKVQIVLLISYSKGFIKENEIFFEFISKFIANRGLVNLLINNPTYETFVSIVETIYRKE